MSEAINRVVDLLIWTYTGYYVVCIVLMRNTPIHSNGRIIFIILWLLSGILLFLLLISKYVTYDNGTIRFQKDLI